MEILEPRIKYTWSNKWECSFNLFINFI